MAIKITILIIYVVLILSAGLIGLRKTKNFNDFFLGGGSIGPWMSAFSYGTAYFSAVLFIGFAGQIGWNFGFSGLWIALFNAIIGVMGVWLILGWRIKKMSIELGVSTISEFLERRYNSRFLKLLASIVIFIFMIPYSAAVFMGLSYLFTTNFNIDFHYALLFMGVLTAVYLVMGGYKSMALIDMVFGFIMVAGVIILFSSTLHSGGGLNNISQNLSQIDPGLSQWVGPPGFWHLFSIVFLTSIAPFAMPQLVQKFYAIRDRKAVKTGMIISTLFALLIGGVAYFVGSTTRIFITPDSSPEVFSSGVPIPDRLMPEMLTNIIPESLAIAILLLILSASMSTLAAIVLISSSSFSKDFVAGFIKTDISEKSLTLLTRVMSAFFILLSVLLAYMNLDSIVAILSISWGALGSFFIGPFLWGLFSKRVNRTGALASGIAGLATCIGLYFTGTPSPEAGTIGMITSFLINPLVSFLSGRTR